MTWRLTLFGVAVIVLGALLMTFWLIVFPAFLRALLGLWGYPPS